MDEHVKMRQRIFSAKVVREAREPTAALMKGAPRRVTRPRLLSVSNAPRSKAERLPSITKSDHSKTDQKPQQGIQNSGQTRN